MSPLDRINLRRILAARRVDASIGNTHNSIVMGIAEELGWELEKKNVFGIFIFTSQRRQKWLAQIKDDKFIVRLIVNNQDQWINMHQRPFKVALCDPNSVELIIDYVNSIE